MEKEKKAIERLKAFEPECEPYYLCYSGGKDSDCIRILAQLAGVKHEVHHNLTTVDAPETVRYVKSVGAIIDKAYYSDGKQKTMWNLIVNKKIPPTRLIRYCCEELKEHGGKGKMKITGVRWGESKSRKECKGIINIIGKSKTMQKKAESESVEYNVNRQGGLILNMDNSENRRFVENCYRTTSTLLNPIIDWTDSDVWEFLHYYGCDSNPLYQCGFKRIGCIGCPFASYSMRYKEFGLYPKYRKNYIRAFDKMLLARNQAGLTNNAKWDTAIDVFKWWMNEDINQLSFFDEE
ncbi:MAG: phosphoadenosine phosphosulfate reductase family protein [Oscillospiraceae bacterium]|nr:phosphoadenosine phosphosulfate reductase family protein [Oscillospiraceae bacterium]